MLFKTKGRFTMDVIGYSMRQNLIPLGGEGTPIAPPTYGEGKFAVSDNGSVVINATAAEAHDVSLTMKKILDDVCPGGAPGIYVGAPADGLVEEFANSTTAKNSVKDTILEDDVEGIVNEIQYAIDQALSGDGLSTWTVSHRQADSIIRYSIDPDTGRQLWAGGEIGSLVRNSGNGDDMARNFPNSALLGMWLSSRSPRPVKIARSIASQVVGYDAQEIVTGASKIDPFGGIPTSNMLVGGNFELSIDDKGKGQKPSEVGFGSIPGTVKTTHFVCDDIVRNATFSTRALKSATNLSDEIREVIEALGVVSLCSMDGGFYRSGTDLIPVSHELVEILSDGSRREVDVDEVVSRNMEIVRNGAHIFASPIDVELSKPIIALIFSKISGLAKGKE